MKMNYRRASFICALLTGILGGLTLIGWISGQETLASLRQNYIPMAPSTALGFAILGAVLAHRDHRFMRRPVPELALLVVVGVAGEGGKMRPVRPVQNPTATTKSRSPHGKPAFAKFESGA